MIPRSLVLLFSAAVLLSSSICAAQSQSSRPVRWVLGFATGGSPDNIARAVSPQLAAELGQPVVLDNRPGANGIMGAEIVANAAPDGHTLLVTSSSFAVNPSVYRKLPFDPVKSFTPITNLCFSYGMLLVVNASFPARNVKELIALMKKPGSRLVYGTSGIGNNTHLAGALFNDRAGTNLAQVTYKGGGPLTIALLSNEVHVVFTNPATIISQVKAGRVRALAYIAPARAPFLPEVPTIQEAGVTGMDMDPSWYGVFAPAGTPPAIVSRLYEKIRAALADPGVKERLAVLEVKPDGQTPAEFRKFVEGAIERSAEIVRLAGIKPQ